MTRPVLILLHALGGSARAWDGVVAALQPDLETLALDLPGFGGRADATDFRLDAMVDWLAGEVRRRDPASYLLVGHSMGGKLATLLAARAEAGEPGLSGLAGVVLLAGSPPSPEPMDEARREEMLGWVRHGTPSEEQARSFVQANTATALPAPLMDRAVADVRRSSGAAWRAWLEQGSREDRGADLGRLDTPALIVAGGMDEDLGESSQRRLNLPHYRRATMVVVEGAAHLLPYETPNEVARLLIDFAHQVETSPSLSPDGLRAS